MTMKTVRNDRFTNFSLRVVVVLALCGSAFAQQVASPGTSPLSPTADTTSSDSSASSSSASNASGLQFAQRDSLTAAQIISILQQKPELVVELKSQVADQLQQQGVQ